MKHQCKDCQRTYPTLWQLVTHLIRGCDRIWTQGSETGKVKA